eukprot:679263_1
MGQALAFFATDLVDETLALGLESHVPETPFIAIDLVDAIVFGETGGSTTVDAFDLNDGLCEYVNDLDILNEDEHEATSTRDNLFLLDPWRTHLRLFLETLKMIRFGVRIRAIDTGSENTRNRPLNDISKAHRIKGLYSWKVALLLSHTNRSAFVFVPHISFVEYVDAVNVVNDLNSSSNDALSSLSVIIVPAQNNLFLQIVPAGHKKQTKF